MGKLNRILALTVLFLFMGMLAFAGGPKRKIQFPENSRITPLKPYAEGEVLAKFKKGVSLDAVNRIAGQNTMIVKKHFPTLSKLKGYEYVVLKSSAGNSLDMLNALKNNPAIEAVSLNYRNELAATPNDTYFTSLWGMHNTGQTGGTADADIDAPEAWNINTGSSSNIVAVIDTGLDYLHPDLAANVWRNATEYAGTAGVDDDGNGYIDDIYGIDPAGWDGATPDTDPMDGYGHGTHCSGTIGGVGNNSLGVAGVNWTVKIMGLKFFDDLGGNGYNSFAIECINYLLEQKVNHGQNVVAINASWGSSYNDSTLKDAIDAAGAQGIVFCASAGNGGSDDLGDDNDTTPQYPSSYTSANIIAVAATNHNDALASFSNYGLTSVDLSGPGVSVLSTVPGAYVPQAGDIFFDNMEGGVGSWTTGGTSSWAISENQESFANASFPVPSPTHFWSDSPGANYAANADSWLTWNANINLSSYVGQDVYLGMGAAVYIEGDNWDNGYVELSGDGGATWTSIFNFSGYAYYWSRYTWLIPDAFKTTQFRFRFRLTSDGSYQYWGWLIDNVGIGTALTYSYESWGGTSMATPHVAGAVALMAAQHPSETMAQRISRILSNVDPIASMSGKCVTGGRLNLYKALSYIVPTVTVTSPNGGESWAVGSGQNITWTSTGTVGNLDIIYSTNSGSSWNPVVTGTANDGSYAWTIPNTPSTTCYVQVLENDGTPNDSSNAVFTITTSTTETVSAPTTPSGPATGVIATSYAYSTGGATSSLGHSIQYQFDWDDGSTSGWLAAGVTTASHSWAAAGTYDVRAMARCVTHTSIESVWSATYAVIISDSSVTGHYNSPAQYKVLPEVIWASATGGGTWISEVQLTDVTGGSQVNVYYNTATGRRGPFLLWNNSGGALSSIKYTNLLQTIDGLDTGTFTYYGTVGAVEFITQDGSHLLHAAVRELNGNYAKTSSALSLHDANTATTSRAMIVSNLSSNATYRATVGFFNPTADSITVEFTLLNNLGALIGTQFSKTFAGHAFLAFGPFTEAGVPYPGNSYDSVILRVRPTSGSGKLMCFGATANNTSNDPAAHVAVQGATSYDNGPGSLQVLPEVIWASATGGGTWVSDVQLTDVTGGSQVSVYYNTLSGRRGPFLLWNNSGGAALSSSKYANLLQTIDGLDAGTFTYYGTVGSVEFVTQDGSHLLQAAVRELNGNYAKTFSGLNLVDAETADTTRAMLVQNLTSNASYRTTVGFFNPTADSLTVEFTLLDGSGAQIGSQFSETFAGHAFQAFSPFSKAGVPYPGSSYDNVILRVRPMSGAGKVMCFGATANNASNDPAAHLAVQGQ